MKGVFCCLYFVFLRLRAYCALGGAPNIFPRSFHFWTYPNVFPRTVQQPRTVLSLHVLPQRFSPRLGNVQTPNFPRGSAPAFQCRRRKDWHRVTFFFSFRPPFPQEDIVFHETQGISATLNGEGVLSKTWKDFGRVCNCLHLQVLKNF